MDLSQYLIQNVNSKNNSKLSLFSYKSIFRTMISYWWRSNEEYVNRVKNNFQTLTEMNFSEYEDKIRNGIADHYAEKAFVAGDPQMVENHFAKIKIDSAVIKKISGKCEDKNVILMTLHYGGVEMIPTSLGFLELPAAVFVNYKTEYARKRQVSNASIFGVRICDVKGNTKNDLLHFRKHPHVSMLVCDAFDYWKRSGDCISTKIFSRKCKLDKNVDCMVRLLKADVYFGFMRRTGIESYDFIIEPVESENGRYILPIMKKFEKVVLDNPEDYYAWNEIDQLFDPTISLCLKESN
jgi:lauroyl/myristoyl acyltransferase